MRRHGMLIAAVLVIGLFAVWLTAERSDQRQPRPGATTTNQHTMRLPNDTTTDESVSGSLRLIGQVIDESGRPVRGASVWITPGFRVVETDDLGAFVFDGVPARAYVIRAKLDDSSSGPQPVDANIVGDPITLRVRRGGTLIVLADGERQPIIGARVSLVSVGAPAELEHVLGQRTDAKGTAILRGLPPGYHRATIVADGWVTETTSVLIRQDDPTATIEVRVRMKRGAELTGTVVSSTGRPVADARIWLEDVGRFGAIAHEAATDGEGRWNVAAAAAGTYSLHASSEFFARSAALTVEHDGMTPKRDLVLTLQPGEALRGRVVDERGRGIADAEVEADARGEDRKTTRSREHGAFDLSGLTRRTYLVRARKERLSSTAYELEIGHGATPDLSLLVHDTSIAGIVVNSAGKPLADVIVETRSNPRATSSRTNDKGQFELTGLDPGDVQIAASRQEQILIAKDRASRWARARTGERGVRIVLDSGGGLTGRVMLEGAPVTYFGLVLSPHDSWQIGVAPRGVSASDGRFMFEDVEPGTWDLDIVAEGLTMTRIEKIAVRRGETLALGDIAVMRGQRVRGRVRDVDGKPIGGARVRVGGDDEGIAATQFARWYSGRFATITAADGSYILDLTSPAKNRFGRNLIEAVHLSYGASSVRELPEGDVTIDFVLSPVGSVDGLIDHSQDYVTIYARATRTPEPFRSRMAVADNLGKFTFEELPVGEYELTVEDDGGATLSSTTITVVANKRVSARLPLTTPRVSQ